MAPILGAAIGLVTFTWGLGLEIVDPRHIAWTLVEGDHRIHFLGWHMFFHEPWTVPPGATTTFGYPVGTSVAYTDSIPIFAFLFKLIRAALPTDFQYLGLWLLLCYLLQGVFAVLLLRAAGASAGLQVFGAVLFVISPPLIFRFGHPALSAHWLPLASLWLYFGSDRLTRRVFLWWLLLAAVAAATHPYITMMVLVLGVAHHARFVIADLRGATLKAALSLAAVGATIAGTFWATGYFIIGNSANMQSVGLGTFSMNSLALIMPTEGSALFGRGPFAYATTGQYEGYAYFGAGNLLLLACSLVAVATRRIRNIVLSRQLEHVPIALGCALLVIMALSPTVTAAGSVLFQYDESWWGPLTVFRASGRMFWPVFYLLTLAAVVGTASLARPRTATAVVAIAAAIQAVDLSVAYTGLRGLRHHAWESPLRSTLWSVLPNYKHLMVIPTNICHPPLDALDYTPFALEAGRSGLTINAGFAARYDAARLGAYCMDEAARWRTGDVRHDEIYALRSDLAPGFAERAREPVLCTPADAHQLCFTTESYRRWQQTHDLARQSVPPAGEIRRLHAALEAIYRDELHRSAQPSAVSAADASEWVARYLAYRVTGCAHDEAATKVLDQLENGNPLRLCGAQVTARADVPPRNETLQFRMALNAAKTSPPDPAGASTTHLDVEGQVVWIQEYVQLRLAGRSEGQATAEVRAAIRRAAG